MPFKDSIFTECRRQFPWLRVRAGKDVDGAEKLEIW